jgi:hypothetical protein
MNTEYLAVMGMQNYEKKANRKTAFLQPCGYCTYKRKPKEATARYAPLRLLWGFKLY